MAQFLDEDGEDLPDPFSRERIVHPALGDPHHISSDIYTPLFNDFLYNDIFDRWLRRMNTWQLHFLGGPGAGKTTIAALVIDRIRKTYSDSLGSATHYASISITDSPIENELAFLEDLLDNVYRQLTPIGLLTSSAVVEKYEKYTDAQNTGKRASLRLKLIEQAVQKRVAEIRATGRAFLVVDNIDQCSPLLGELLHRALCLLQGCGLGVAITSRLPQYGNLRDVYCDFHELRPCEGRLAFYRYCSMCEKSFVCESCDSPGTLCKRCGDETDWTEPDHLELIIDSIYQRLMEKFIAWDLEREHGNLGLESDVQNHPPLSSFGAAFLRDKPGDSGRKWLRMVVQSVNGSVVQAKLALDRIHSATSPVAVNFSPNRIPRNVQELLHTAIKSINYQPASQRELALKSLAAVGKEGSQDMGIPLSRLAGLLRRRSRTSSASIVPPRSAEDVLASAKGYLKLMPPRYGETQYTIVAFNRVLFRYINEDYNDELVMANSQLRTSKIPTSFTRALQSPVVNSPEPSWQDRLRELKRFQSPKLPNWSARIPPPMRRISSGSNRSLSFNMLGAPLVTSPASGLGLEFEGREYKEDYIDLDRSHATQEETQVAKIA